MTETELETELLAHLKIHYSLPTITRLDPVTVGLIHKTYLVMDATGPVAVAQGLHPALSDEAILSDYELVTTHLTRLGYGGPELIKTRDGQRACRHGESQWRLSTYVKGETYTEVESLELIHCGGRGLADFHRVMRTLEGAFNSTHPGHDTSLHLSRLRAAVAKTRHAQAWDEIKRWGEPILTELEQTLFPETLPRGVVHGDPKISNLRFQSAHHETRAVMIDLDTCNIHTRLVDLGDAVRSWCHRPEAASGSRFSIERWRALVAGYLSVADELTPLERVWLPRAGRVITLELASRFAWDYLEDSYFAYDAERFPSRRAHNAARMREMYQLAVEMRAALPDLVAWLDTSLDT